MPNIPSSNLTNCPSVIAVTEIQLIVLIERLWWNDSKMNSQVAAEASWHGFLAVERQWNESNTHSDTSTFS